MDDLLKPIQTTTTVKKAPTDILPISQREDKTTQYLLESPEDALKLLKDQPSYEAVQNVLEYISATIQNTDSFSVAAPGPLSARIINTLVTVTIPDYWRTLKESDAKGKSTRLLIQCLRSVSGLGAIIARLRPLVADAKQKKTPGQTRNPVQHIEDLLDVLSQILEGDATSLHIWNQAKLLAPNEIQRTLLWKEFISFAASGRIISVVAQAEDALKDSNSSRKESWLAKGEEYASWLGENIVAMIVPIKNLQDYEITAIAQLCGKALTLGYTDRMVSSILIALLRSGSISTLQSFIPKLLAHEQRHFFNSTLSFLAKQYFGSVVDAKDESTLKASRTISGSARLIHDMIVGNALLKDQLISLLTSSSSSGLDLPLSVRRSTIAAISGDQDSLQKIMEKSLKLFGDTLYIAHTPTLQQEALSQTLLISCGYVHRSEPMFLSVMARSSIHMNATSNRMAASSPRARFLGMAVGMAISELVDKPELRLKFELDENEQSEARWYQGLIHVEDKIGSIQDLKSQLGTTASKNKSGSIPAPQKRSSKLSTSKITTVQSQIVGPRIVEVDEDSEDDDLIPYAKPDSDPEDDTDDPTLVQRNKPTAPVYIRDLIAGLQDQENYERHELALSTAASLVRRKANFGTEVTDHIEELARILVGLNDNLDIPRFAELRQQALIAVLLAKPAQMSQWFAHSFFSGDYSLTQRIAMLTTMGLGARELAGFKDESDSSITTPTPSFPSKTLPPKLHKLYAAESQPVAILTNRLEKMMIEPMALNAADKLSGPNILKVRTFSSRMEVEKKRKKPIPNALAQIVAQNFFFPLTGRWWIHMQSSEEKDNFYTSPHLLPPYLQTLAILMHASGPNTLQLPQMTREFWDLLLSVRGIAVHDKTILSALLFAFLTLLETNEDKSRLATEQGKELMETQEWVRGVFERLGGGAEEDEKVRVLAAGVLVRCQEVVEKYQRLMVGDMVDF